MVLFDIDGTLLDTGGAGREAFARGLARATGQLDELEYVSFAGNTDRNVIEQVMTVRGLHLTEEEIRRIFRCMAEELRGLLVTAVTRQVPGSGAFVNRLAQMGARLGLVTGNIRACAYLKLASVGLDGHFDFGGFGDDFAEREKIARSALAAAQAAGHAVPAERICLVGDTPWDVAAGKALGIPVLGVASGKFGADDLLAAGAEEVTTDFTDGTRLIKWLDQRLG